MPPPTLEETKRQALRFRGGPGFTHSDIETSNAAPTVALRWPSPPPNGKPPLDPYNPNPQPAAAKDCEPFPAGLTCQFRVRAVAMSASKAATFELVGLFSRQPSGALLQVASPASLVAIADDPSWAVSLVVGNGLVEVHVQGDAAQKTRWFVVAEPVCGLYPFT